MGQWIVDVISFQKIFGLCGIKRYIMDKGWDAMLEENGRRDKCEERARNFGNSQYNVALADIYLT